MGDVYGITGDVYGVTGDVYGVTGDVYGITGDVWHKRWYDGLHSKNKSIKVNWRILRNYIGREC